MTRLRRILQLSSLGTALGGLSLSFFKSSSHPRPMKPPNFSWIVEGLLAGSAFPYRPGHFQFYEEQGIKHVVTLTEWPAPSEMAPDINFHHIAIEEFSAPSLDQMKEFVAIVDSAREKGEKVVAHCYWGRGRTGTMLAAYLVYKENRPPMESVHHVRKMRPYSVETYEQEEAVIGFAQHLLKGQMSNDSNQPSDP